jgi:tetratricopeptide (TPR) repeat protein
MAQATADLAVLQTVIAADTTSRRPALLQAAGRLSVIVALGLVASGQPLLARRWWSTADRLADESGDPDTQVLTRAWNVVNGCYDGRPLAQAIALSDRALPLAGDRPTAATCGLLAGRAQALALAGRHTEATAAVEQLADITARLPATLTSEVESLWGWPEHRLRHTESYVHTYTGALAEAEAAQDRALELYPASQVRLRTQVQLHRASCLIQAGHVADGLRYAADLIDGLPSEQHNEVFYAVARQVAAVVPSTEHRQPVYGELTARVGR